MLARQTSKLRLKLLHDSREHRRVCFGGLRFRLDLSGFRDPLDFVKPIAKVRNLCRPISGLIERPNSSAGHLRVRPLAVRLKARAQSFNPIWLSLPGIGRQSDGPGSLWIKAIPLDIEP